MKNLALWLAGALVAPSLGLAACATDNGPNVYGETYGPTPQRPDAGDDASGGGGEDGEAPPGDGGGDADASEGGPPPCQSGTVAVLAGGAASLSGAVQEKGGAWAGAAIAGGAAKSKPAIVAFGSGFLAVTHGAADALQTLAFTTSWGTPSALGVADVKGAPVLAVAGTQAHVVYSAGPNMNRDFHHGVHDGAAWNAATAAVGPPPSFGTVSAGLGASGAGVVFAENGTDNGLYVRSFTGGAWGGSAAITGAGTVGNSTSATPVLVPVEGAAIDMVLVFAETDERLAFATRAGGVWTDRDRIPAFLQTKETFSVARVGQFTLLVAFRGTDGKGYYVSGTVSGSTVNWSAVAPIGGAAVSVDHAPAIAKGVCGDDAIVVYASGGAVKATRLRGTTWTPAEAVTGASGEHVAVATR